MVTIYNITGYQGDNINLNLNLKNESGSVIELDGYSMRGQVRYSYGSTGILLNLNPSIVNSQDGKVSINISSLESKNLPIGDHIYDVELYPSGIQDGNSNKILAGKFSVLPEVTR